MLLVFLPTVTSFTSAKFSLMMLLEPVPRPPHAMFIGDLRRGESLKQKTRTKKGKRETEYVLRARRPQVTQSHLGFTARNARIGEKGKKKKRSSQNTCSEYY